jgi:hypothetical protein
MIPTRWTSFCVFAYEFSDHLCHFLDMQIQLRLYPHTRIRLLLLWYEMWMPNILLKHKAVSYILPLCKS